MRILSEEVKRCILASGYCGEQIIWELDNCDTLSISGNGKIDSHQYFQRGSFGWNCIAPWSQYNNRIKTVIIADRITEIADFMFYAGEMRCFSKISIPFSVSRIGMWAFAGCRALKQLRLPPNLTRIEEFSFWRCRGLESIMIPHGVTSIGKGAFDNCSSFVELNLPSSVKEIGKGAFSGCRRLTKLKLPSKLEKIEAGTFCACCRLVNITIPRTVIHIECASFLMCNNLRDIYYTGSPSDWEKITIENGNDALTRATIHYNSRME